MRRSRSSRLTPQTLALIVLVMLTLTAVLPDRINGQSPERTEFEIVSIKRNMSEPVAVDRRTLPDGSVWIVNMPVRAFIVAASPAPTSEVFGLPDWAFTERYDVIVKPPAGSTADQLDQMWRTMFAGRMKLVAHVERRERDV